MSVWRRSTLYRSVHSYSTLFLKHEGQISVEVTGKRRKTRRIKRICRRVDGVGVGIHNEQLTLKLFYCYRLNDFDSCWSVSHFSFVTFWHLYVISVYIIRLSFWVVFFIRRLRYIEVLSHTFYYIFSRARVSLVIPRTWCKRGSLHRSCTVPEAAERDCLTKVLVVGMSK